MESLAFPIIELENIRIPGLLAFPRIVAPSQFVRPRGVETNLSSFGAMGRGNAMYAQTHQVIFTSAFSV